MRMTNGFYVSLILSLMFVLFGCGTTSDLLQNGDSETAPESDSDSDTDTDTDTDADTDSDADTGTDSDSTTEFETESTTESDTGSSACTYNGVNYGEGDSFADADGCNTCICMRDDAGNGQVACTQGACVAECTYNGVTYPVGSTVDSSDPCNPCYCVLSDEGSPVVECENMNCQQECSELTETACEQSVDCRPIMGQRIDGTELCLAPPTFTGCIDADTGCGDAITFVEHEGDCWQFSDTCVPENTDWGSRVDLPSSVCDEVSTMQLNACATEDTDSDTETDTGITCLYDGIAYNEGDTFDATDGCNSCTCLVNDAGTGSVACTKMACEAACTYLSETECTSAANCAPIRGHIIDTVAGCIGELTYAGCQSGDTVCGDEVTYARDANNCWQFMSTCLPQNAVWNASGGDPADICGAPDSALENCEAAGCDALGETCCNKDCPCTLDGAQCTPTHWTANGELMGKCVSFGAPENPPVNCWDRSECGAQQFCEGARVCQCGISCVAPDSKGKCVDASEGECDASAATDTCPDKYSCYEMGEQGDICLHDPEGLQCWTDEQCGAGFTCDDVYLCGSNVWCLSEPGQCTKL